MKIALIGYGKMGHAIEKTAIERGHEIVCRIDADNTEEFDSPEFASADVAIEFSTPATAVDNYLKAFSHNVKVVSGTTGWLEQMPRIREMCLEGKGTMLWTSNFSLGVNIFFALNGYLAAILGAFPQYNPSLEEIHHIHKLDHPSGTAITLAQGIMANDSRITSWSETDPADGTTMKVTALREGEVPGTHIVRWDSPADTLTIEHQAKSREGFALGAVVAAEWTAHHNGWLTMDEMLHSLIPDSNLLDIVK